MKVACTVLNGESGSNAADLHNKTADGTFGYGYCRDMEDSYSAWKQAEIDIYILYVH